MTAQGLIIERCKPKADAPPAPPAPDVDEHVRNNTQHTRAIAEAAAEAPAPSGDAAGMIEMIDAMNTSANMIYKRLTYIPRERTRSSEVD